MITQKFENGIVLIGIRHRVGIHEINDEVVEWYAFHTEQQPRPDGARNLYRYVEAYIPWTGMVTKFSGVNETTSRMVRLIFNRHQVNTRFLIT